MSSTYIQKALHSPLPVYLTMGRTLPKSPAGLEKHSSRTCIVAKSCLSRSLLNCRVCLAITRRSQIHLASSGSSGRSNRTPNFQVQTLLPASTRKFRGRKTNLHFPLLNWNTFSYRMVYQSRVYRTLQLPLTLPIVPPLPGFVGSFDLGRTHRTRSCLPRTKAWDVHPNRKVKGSAWVWLTCFFETGSGKWPVQSPKWVR